jgi:hypothetical protein
LTPHKIQIIKRRVDTHRLDGKYGDEGKYYQEIKNSIKRGINKDADVLFIDLLPKEPVTNMCTLEILLHLQGEFTNQLIVPQHDFNAAHEEINEITNFLKAKNVMYGV